MTCKQLGGACEMEFRAETFQEMAEQSKQHGMEMFQKSDGPHLEAMAKMQELMQSPEDMNKWMAEKQQEFDQLPSN